MTNEIDEINAYRNPDGTFNVDLFAMGDRGPLHFTMPAALISLEANISINTATSLTIKLEGTIESE